jgi:hypothetical protein
LGEDWLALREHLLVMAFSFHRKTAPLTPIPSPPASGLLGERGARVLFVARLHRPSEDICRPHNLSFDNPTRAVSLSEILGLRWEDVNWEAERVTIRSPKTEHQEGKEQHVIPLLPELRPHLEEAWEFAEEGTEYVITRYRESNVNLRTQLIRIIERAGLTPWPKLFHNLGATRETELAEQFPAHVVTAWIGQSEQIAAKHYLQVTDDHLAKAAQKAAAAHSRRTSHGRASDAGPTEQNPVFAGECERVRRGEQASSGR